MINRGDIYIVNLTHIATENIQTGIRPCVIVSNNNCNKYSPVVSIVPLTTKHTKAKLPTHVNIKANKVTCIQKDSIALCEQIISVPKKYILEKRGHIETNEIDKAIMIQLSL